jgi:Lon protease-like protein
MRLAIVPSCGESELEVIRLFPLARVVLFPHAVLPLHIFEPRYKQMTEEALRQDRRIAIASPVTWPASEPVPIHPIVCVGRIINEVRLPDGRFKFLLVGERRMRIESELPMEGRLFRQARARPIQDVQRPALKVRRDIQRAYLLGLLRRCVINAPISEDDLCSFLRNNCNSSTFADLLSFSCPLAYEVRQQLLETCDVDARLEILSEEIPKLLKREPTSGPPICFGTN